jgi:hypothetical protein
MPSPRIASIYRYPIKGLTGEMLTSIDLPEGDTIPFDRVYAIENGPGRFDPNNPQHLPKINFLMLMRNERLATLRSAFDPLSQTLTIFRQGKQVARGNLSTRIGRQMIEQFIAAYMKDALRGPPHIVSSPGHSFTDTAAKCVHIVNVATVEEIARVVGKDLDPLRFRANLYLEGLPAWQESKWIGKRLSVGGAALSAFKRTQRCDATNVDPATGERDTAIPAVLQRTWGHSDVGIYARVVAGGQIAVGDEIKVEEGQG